MQPKVLGIVILLFAALAALGLAAGRGTAAAAEKGGAAGKPAAGKGKDVIEKVVKTDAEWKRELTPEQYRILRQAGTERAFTGKLVNNHEHGVYRCAACHLPLFTSATKFESGTGWPSFWAPIAPNHVEEKSDWSFGMRRTEVLCARCGGHLGHVFDDGPQPTGLRYCMNSGALEFVKEP